MHQQNTAGNLKQSQITGNQYHILFGAFCALDVTVYDSKEKN